ncbi:Hsp20/alpha crystallin family protein [Bacteroidota bacterium]
MLPRIYNRTSFLPEFVNEFFGSDSLSRFFDGYTSNASIPNVNVAEGKDEYKIEVAAPGLSKNDFKVDVHDNLLEISSERSVENEEKNENYVRREFNYNSFKRSFSLPDEVDADKIKASHKDGILNILIPKKEEAKDKGPRVIKIS